MTMTDTPPRGLPERGLKFMRTLAGPYFIGEWDMHERGQGNVPETGPVIIASNHIGWVDGPLLFAQCAATGCTC